MFKQTQRDGSVPSTDAVQKVRADVSKVDAYLREASAWDIDRRTLLRRSERRAWILTSVFAVIAACSMAAIALLMPLKTVEPFVIRVDNSTGIVDIVNSLRTSSNTYDEAVSKYFLGRYLRAKEGYTPSTFGIAYQEAGYLSSSAMKDALYQEFNPQNPASPVNVYKQGEAIVQIKTIAFLKPNLASVRYVKRAVMQDREATTHWVATIEFKYHSSPDTEDARQYNPLGFQVKSFRADPETIVETTK